MAASKASPAVGIGIVGAGRIGQLAHIASFAEVEDCRIVALAELRPELGRLAAEKFGVPRVYGSHRKLMEDADVDAVVVVTRRAATGPIVLDALAAGKHVLSEKPMAHTVAQGSRLVAAASAGNLRYAVGYMKRHDAGLARAKLLLDELVASNELGRIVRVRGYCFGGDIGCPSDGYVMTDEERPEGLELWPVGPDWIPKATLDDYAGFLNVNVHMLNILRYLTGRMPRVSSVDLKGGDGGAVNLDFDQFNSVVEIGDVASGEWEEGVEVTFEGGRLGIQFPPPLRPGVAAWVELRRGSGARELVASPEHQVWSFQRQAEAFVANVVEDREPLASGADSLSDLALAEDIWRLHLEASADDR